MKRRVNSTKSEIQPLRLHSGLSKITDDMNRPHILILTSDRLSQKSLFELLSRSGYRVDIADSIKQSVAYLNEFSYNAVLADIDASSGIELLKVIKDGAYPAQVVVLSSYGNVENALSSLKLGAFDYLIKPVEDEKIISTIEKALANRPQGASKPVLMKNLTARDDSYYGLIGKSNPIAAVYLLIERVASSRATILLKGESGTGKRVIARAIHNADTARRSKPFIEISCGALPSEIIESELFGHTKGAFTGAINDRKGRFELAHGGTILLDDIDTFSLDLQVKLLRVLQEKEFERVGDHKTIRVDVRVIVATNQNLEKAILEGKFREDLYYRLNVIPVDIPPLRDRKDDLPPLVRHFVKVYSNENHKRIVTVSDETIRIMTNYNWPGNVRELENIIERAVILDVDGVIGTDDLPEMIIDRCRQALEPVRSERPENELLKDALKEPEKVYILKVLDEVGWNKKKAATRLGVNRTTLYNKLRKHNLISVKEL